MKELVCNYALIRFLPYRETGEFVNIGVVLYAPEIQYFDFRVAEKRNRRVKAFFPEMDSRVYRTAVEAMRAELKRRQDGFAEFASLFGRGDRVGEGLTMFRSMLRRRESLLHFAEPGMKLGSPTETLNLLYDEYVLRRFAMTPAYQETVMRRQLSAWLEEWGLRKQYKVDKQVGDDLYSITFPFVHFEGDVTRVAIKPLDLNRSMTTEVYDHGGSWVQRFRRLAKHKHLPERTVVPLLMPAGGIRAAADEILAELNDAGVQTADFNDAARVHELSEL